MKGIKNIEKSKKKQVAGFVVISVLFSLIVFVPSQIVKADADPNTVILWTVSDMHIRPDGGAYTCSPSAWSDVISDAVYLGANYSICIGDCVEDEGSAQAWSYFWENSGQTYGWEDTIDLFDFTQVTIGNHDGGWGANMPSPYGEQFTYTFGNVLIIGVYDGYPNKNDYGTYDTSSWAGRYQVNHLDYINTTIQANQDKNILLMIHHPIYETTYESGGSTTGHHGMYVYENADGCSPGYGCGHDAREENTNFTNMLTWLVNNSMHLDAWVHGHTHSDHNQLNFIDKYGTTFISDLKISISGGSEDRSSLFWYFTDNSNVVGIKAYNHDSNVWLSDATNFPSGTHDFTLTYDFDLGYDGRGGEENIQFIYINDGINGSVNQDVTPTMNWTLMENTSRYHLQIDNNQDFSSPEVNLSDINEENYPSYYVENATIVSFLLPDIYALPSIQYYFYRIKAYFVE